MVELANARAPRTIREILTSATTLLGRSGNKVIRRICVPIAKSGQREYSAGFVKRPHALIESGQQGWHRFDGHALEYMLQANLGTQNPQDRTEVKPMPLSATA